MTTSRRNFVAFTSLIAALAVSGCATPGPAGTAAALRMEEFRVPALDAGIELYVRNKRPAAMTSWSPARTVVFVHGATYPAETAFDLALDGQSWMDYIAQRGYDVWLLDVRGYGRSTRPPPMAQAAELNPPLASGAEDNATWTR